MTNVAPCPFCGATLGGGLHLAHQGKYVRHEPGCAIPDNALIRTEEWNRRVQAPPEVESFTVLGKTFYKGGVVNGRRIVTSSLSEAAHSLGGPPHLSAGQQVYYVMDDSHAFTMGGEPVHLPCVTIANEGGWWRVRFADSTEAVVRPSRLSRSR